MPKYNKQYEPIVIGKPLFDVLLKQEKPSDLIALYCFYYYTSKWQSREQNMKLDTAKATTSYTAEGLRWNKNKVIKNKKKLIELGLIEDKVTKDKKTNQITGHYIFINFIWSNEKIVHITQNPEGGSSQSQGKGETNTHSYNNTNTHSNSSKTIINNCNGFSRKSNQSFDSPKRKSNHLDLKSIRLINYWNSFPQTSNHKISKPYNKNCLSMIKELNSLQKGTFSKNKQFDSEWIKNIPDNYFTRPWTYQELKNGLEQAAKYSMDGYWPPDKKQFKSLSYILYSSIAKKSWLLTAMASPPALLSDSTFKNPFPEITKQILKNYKWPENYKIDERKLARGVKQLKEFVDGLYYDPDGIIRMYYGSLPKIVKEYFNWLETQGWVDLNENIIGTKNKMFEKFIAEQEKDIGIRINSRSK